MNITDLFVTNIMCFASNPIERKVLHHARKCYLDYLGCVLAGSKTNSKKIHELIQSGLLSSGECIAFGVPIKLSFRDAAFLNGFNSHSMEMDDGHRYAMVHIEAPIFSAMLALMDKECISAEDFYRGIIVGYEVTIRIARSLQPSHKLRGFHSTGTCSTLGIAMAAATALHFDFHQTKAALSAAASSASGLLEMLANDSELKPYNVARAVLDGLTSAYIGKVRFHEPDDVLGGIWGFEAVMTDTPHYEFLTEFKEEEPYIMSNYFKPYAACRHCHSTIDATLHIAQNNKIDVAKISKIKIETYKMALLGHDHTEVKSTKSAMMSIPYSSVVAIAKKNAGMNQYTTDVVMSEEIQSLLNKVEICENFELTSCLPDIRGAIVEIEVEGKRYKKRVNYSLGEPENPMSDDALIAKFKELALYAGINVIHINSVVEDVLKGKIITLF